MTTTHWLNRCHFGDCLETLRQMPDGLVQTCVTSPPYFGLRDYSGGAAEIGREKTPDEFVAKLVSVFREVRRVLRDDGTLWLNIGDSYAGAGPNRQTGFNGQSRSGKYGDGTDRRKPIIGFKPKDLIGIPWMLAFALRADGWYLRQEIIWHKPNPMPESVTDRCTKSHEQIFLLAKSANYYCDMDAIKEPAVGQNEHDLTGPGYAAPGQAPNTGNRKALRTDIESRHRSQIPGGQSLQAKPDGMRNKRSVWTVSTKPYKGAHFATFPTDLIEPCILAGAPTGGVVLDPFFGSGTTGQVAQALGRQFIGLELNEAYKPLQDERLRQPSLLLEAA